MDFGNTLISRQKKQLLEIEAINLSLRSGVGKWETQHPCRLIHLLPQQTRNLLDIYKPWLGRSSGLSNLDDG